MLDHLYRQATVIGKQEVGRRRKEEWKEKESLTKEKCNKRQVAPKSRKHLVSHMDTVSMA